MIPEIIRKTGPKNSGSSISKTTMTHTILRERETNSGKSTIIQDIQVLHESTSSHQKNMVYGNYSYLPNNIEALLGF